jgi:hypothetical protein
MPTALLEPISNEVDCDERDLEDPPEAECTWESFDLEIRPLQDSNMEWPERDYTVRIPYLTFAQAAQFRDMYAQMMPLLDVLDTVIGNQVLPDREVTISMAAANPVVTHDDLTEADCTDIPLPANPSMP